MPHFLKEAFPFQVKLLLFEGVNLYFQCAKIQLPYPNISLET